MDRELDGEPILRVAVLDPDRVPLHHQRVEGVPDDVLAAYWDDAEYDEIPLEDFVAQRGGVIHEMKSDGAIVAMTRAREGGYRLSELDAQGVKTGFAARYDTLEEALWQAAFAYGHPPGTITWRESPRIL